MITIISDNFITEEKQQLFLSIIKQLAQESRKEKGCISYTLHQNTENPFHYCIIEEWEDENAIQYHNHTNHFKTLVPQMKACRAEQKKANQFRIMNI